MREHPRVLILAIIVLGHCAALYLLLMARIDVRHDRDGAELISFPIRLTPIPTPGDGVRAGDEVAKLPRRVNSPTRVSPEPEQESTATTPSSSESESESGERIDWAAQAEQRVQKWADANSNSGKSGNATQDEPADTRARNIFKGNSPRQAGYIEMIEPGVERRWLSSRCYIEFGRQRLRSTLPAVNPVRCLVGPGSTRDDLFDHLKPDYLKGEEPVSRR